jgi:hypothetical protein
MGQLSNSSREWGEACDTWGREACIGRAYNFYPEGGGVPLKDFKKVNYVFFLFILFLFIYLFIYLFIFDSSLWSTYERIVFFKHDSGDTMEGY